jgi:hypothetical protein
MSPAPTSGPQSFTGPGTVVRLTSARVLADENGIRSWLSPILSTPIGIQFTYTTIGSRPLTGHAATASISVDDGEPVEIPAATTVVEGCVHTVFVAPNPGGAPVTHPTTVTIIVADPRAGTETLSFTVV